MNNRLLIAATVLLFLSMQAGAQTKKDELLAGKTFAISVIDKTWTKGIMEDEITFDGATLHSNVMNEGYKFDTAPYRSQTGSSGTQQLIRFMSISLKESGEMLSWEGAITGKQIEGTLRWTKKNRVLRTYFFTGAIKPKQEGW